MRQRRYFGFTTLLCGLLMTAMAAPLLAQVNPDLFNAMKWRQIGPFRGGRVVAVSGVPGDPATWYFGGVAGGVWKSSNAGYSWQPVFDAQKIASIGAIAVAESDHNIIYVGTGEACPRGNITYGDGVYKSVDAGKTWQHMGLGDSRHIGAIIVDPQIPDIVFVAALGHAFGPNDERGIFRSADGGKSWQRVLLQATAIAAASTWPSIPRIPNILFASLWQMRRQPWGFASGGPGSGLYRSTDGGLEMDSRLQAHGLPEGPLGRIGIAVSGADSQRVYAADRGEGRRDIPLRRWRRQLGADQPRPSLPAARLVLLAHLTPTRARSTRVYVLNTGAFRSTDGGKEFKLLPAPHGDHHALVDRSHRSQAPHQRQRRRRKHLLDGGTTWTQQDNQPTAQFYHVVTDNALALSRVRRAAGQYDDRDRQP